jgi:hypothetical protein
MTMEFEELQKIWDSQNEEPLYGINEKALHNRILLKKKQAYHISNISELLVILVNSGAGCFILALNLSNQNGNVAMYVLAAWMFASALYVLVSRISRIRGESQFDRSLRGDLSHAISMAMYQVRLSQLMRWNILPIGILSLLGMWEGGKSVWVAVGIFVFFALAYYAGGWEQGIYIRRKRELELLKAKLEN